MQNINIYILLFVRSLS